MNRIVIALLSTCYLGFAMQAQELQLSNSFVNDVAVDARDRVWAATEEGLNCFDGIEVRSFLKQTGGMPGSQLNRVLVDRCEPLVWVATQKAGLVCYDMRTEIFTVYRAGESADSLIDNDISEIGQAPDGAIWAASFSKGLCRLDREKGTFERFNAESFEGMRDVPLHTFTFLADKLILGYYFGGISIQSLTDHSRIDLRVGLDPEHSLPSDQVRSLLVDSRRRIWVGTLGGLALCSESGRLLCTFQHKEGDPDSLPDNAVYDLVEDGSGHLIVATSAGVATLEIGKDIKDEGMAHFTPLTLGIQDHSDVRSVVQDRFGNLWLGTYGNGLLFHGGEETGAGKLQPFPLGSSNQDVQALFAGNDGHLAVGLNSGRVRMIPSGQDYTIPESGGFNPILSLMKDKKGRWWTGTASNGLYLSAGGNSRHIPLENSPQNIRALLEDDNSVYVGTDNGLYKISLDDLSGLGHWTRYDGLPDNLIRTLLKDSAGRLWVGTFGHGMVVYGEDMEVIAQYGADSGLPSDIVNDLLLQSDGSIWVATAAGLVRFESGDIARTIQPRLVTDSEWVLEGNFRALAEDSRGNIWASLNNAVFCLLTDGEMLTFDSRDGLPGGNYYNAAAAVDAQGWVWFGNTDGVAWIDPETLMTGRKLPPVSFLTAPEDLSTDYKNNYLNVRFCIPDHSLARRVEYEYRLQDINDGWHACGTELDFYSLPSGRHTLQVRARLHSQEWGNDYEISSAVLYIRPPFWKTWWARILYVLSAIAAVAISILSWNRRNARKNREQMERDMLVKERQVSEERMMFFTNVTHELRTPLTLILGPLQDLSEDKSIPANALGRIGKVRQSAQHLLGLVNQLLEFRKTESGNRRLTVREDSLSRCVEVVGERFRDSISMNKAVSFVMAVEPDIRLLFDPESVVIILNNLLSNAQKYTPAGVISLALQRRGDRVAISVSDTGIGISTADQQHIFDQYYQVKGPHQASGTGIGLALVKNLCDQHHMEISVSSEPGKGSEFCVLMDPSEQYPEADHLQAVDSDGEEQEPSVARDPDKVCVLVVEDNLEILDYIRESLSEEYEVLSATQGREGLKIAIREIPDIIVSDIMMPVMNGIDMCKAIRLDIRTSHIPIVLLTAKSAEEDRVEGYDVGADSYLVKPFRKSLLTSRIRNLLERRKRMMAQVSESGSAPELSQVDNEFLKRFTLFVENHLSDERIDVISLAGEFAMSQSTLYRKVKAVSGLSPAELVRIIRLSKAAEMLKGTALTISEISWQTGFGSPVYFRDCFKERYGMTPSEYRGGASESKA